MPDSLSKETRSLPRYRTALLIGGPLDGQHVAIPPHESRYVVATKNPVSDSASFDTTTYRRETFGVSNAGAIEVFVHESESQDALSRRIFSILLNALNAYPVD